MPVKLKTPSTAEVADLIIAGKFQNFVSDMVIGRTRVHMAIYHEGLWYRIDVCTTDLQDVIETFGSDATLENQRDPEFPNHILPVDNTANK